jgi:hypothetical protein
VNSSVMDEADRLVRIADELVELAASLRSAKGPAADVTSLPVRKSRMLSEAAAFSPKLVRLAANAKAQYDTRRSRAMVLPAKLLGEAAWDMILDLFINQVAGKKVSISSACIAADVPSTTALRYIYILEADGLIKRTDDRYDQRRSFVELTDDCFIRMCRYLDNAEGVRAAATGSTIAEFGLIVRE